MQGQVYSLSQWFGRASTSLLKMNMKTKHTVLVILLLLACLPLSLWLNGVYVRHKTLAPFKVLAQNRATESELIAKEGKSEIVITTTAELRNMADSFVPTRPLPQHIEAKIYLYGEYPFMVYVVIGRDGRLHDAILGINY